MEGSGLHLGKGSEPTHHSDAESLFAMSALSRSWQGMVSADIRPSTSLPAYVRLSVR